jgi:hypothetical protein
MIFVVIFLLMFSFWIFAEKQKLHFFARFGSGLACMTFVGLAIDFVGHIGPSYESNFHRVDMLRMEQAITNGDTQSVFQALEAYNRIAATGSTYQAAMQMGPYLPVLKQP